jgi:glycosyltransferase involved in cell wall biosynthesis
MEALTQVFVLNVRNAVTKRSRASSLSKLKSDYKVAAEEVALCRQADEVVCVSRSDAAMLNVLAFPRRINYLDTGISIIEFADALADREKFIHPEQKEKRIVYIAYFGSETNVIALKWYLDMVHPLIIAEVPGYTFSVAGRGDMTPFQDYRGPSIEFIGEVPSIASHIRSGKVGIAPALSGAGFRGKVNQYAVYGIPCVVTSIAAKGLAYRDGQDIFIADDPKVFAQRCISLLTDNDLNRQIGSRARTTCLEKYTWESSLDKIQRIYQLGERYSSRGPRVTAVVPSYNHGRYVQQRIESILAQTYRNLELIVIDDCSEDNSHDVISLIREKHDFLYIRNERNSGTPFSAWEKAIELATGDYIWICESDDHADPAFLEIAVDQLNTHPGAVLFYSDSLVVDESGNIVGNTDDYFHGFWQETRWDSSFIADGAGELSNFQVRGQTVPNMSSALIATEAFRKAYKPLLKKFKLAGDWLFIGWVMRRGSVVFCKKPLNYYRKHDLTCRVRVQSARSQAEFILTKYLLFRQTQRNIRELVPILWFDAVRFLYEPAKYYDVLKAMFQISVPATFRCAFTIAVSLSLNCHYLKEFYLRYKMVLEGK